MNDAMNRFFCAKTSRPLRPDGERINFVVYEFLDGEDREYYFPPTELRVYGTKDRQIRLERWLDGAIPQFAVADRVSVFVRPYHFQVHVRGMTLTKAIKTWFKMWWNAP